MTSEPILHIALPDDLGRARREGRYRCASLDTEGFVHCCDADQLAGVVERYYAGIDDLVLLEIDPDSLDVPLRRENTAGGEEAFPHVHGGIPLAAIRRTRPFGLESAARVGLADTAAATAVTGDDDRR